jgi:hypothetical protein
MALTRARFVTGADSSHLADRVAEVEIRERTSCPDPTPASDSADALSAVVPIIKAENLVAAGTRANAGAAAGWPDIILLDEPLAAVDALRRLELRAALREIVTACKATAVLVTHDVDEALAVGNRQVVLERGGAGARLLEPPGRAGTDPRESLLAALGVPFTSP